MHGLSDMNAHRNIEKEALLLLLKAGLWGKPTDCSTVFPLTDLEWKQLLNAARKQTVEGIVYEGLSLLPEKWLPAENILFRWAAEAEHIEQRNQKMNGVLAELQQLFTAHGLHPVVLTSHSTLLPAAIPAPVRRHRLVLSLTQGCLLYTSDAADDDGYV